MKFSVLASGSTGNAIYVEAKGQKLLIDAGLSGKKIEALFKEINVSPAELDGILVSHEHSDHIKGVGILARKYKLPVYANEKTWHAMESLIGVLPMDQKFHFNLGEMKTFSGLDILSFGVSHDAAEPMFYSFSSEGKKLTILTDTGYISEQMHDIARGSNALILETNHDMDMLRMGKYPWSVKRRILGDEGHVSNVDAGIALAEIVRDRSADVYMAHLSKENNLKELARMTVQQTLEENDIEVGAGVKLFHTDPLVATPLKSV